jgi:hypothetical protein
MAKPQSTTGTRARKIRRNGNGQAGVAGAIDAGAQSEADAPGSLHEAIETERGRLSQAESMLGCLHAALMSAEQENRHQPGSADVLAMALRLIKDAIHRLDAAYLEPLIHALRSGGLPRRRRSAGVRR